MHGDPALAPVEQGDRSLPDLADGHDLADERPRRRRSERDRERRLDELALMLDPPAAGGDLTGVWLVVDPPLAAQHELEVLDRIGDVDRRTVDPRLLQRSVKDYP